ncbi:MAG: MarR family transcriptional regulator [Comamonadaceae bacterium]|nr:MAG: MarR family transcriptional regulator [Comamonadaceae bacterium]
MPSRTNARLELTPAGRLEEAQLHQVLGYQLAQARIVTDALFADHVGVPFGLRPVEFTVLTLISENPGGSLARIARALAVTAPNVTAVVDRLEAKGWIERAQSSKDRRSQVLHTTVRGAALVRDATCRILQAEREALALTPGEQAMLVELLHKVACARPAG